MTYQWERDAARGAAMPEDLPLEEQAAFQALRYLYQAYRSGVITKENAAREKGQIIYQTQMMRRQRDMWGKVCDQHARMYKEIEAPADEFFLTKDVAAAEKALRIVYGLRAEG